MPFFAVLATAFAFGSFWFWGALIVFSILFTLCVESASEQSSVGGTVLSALFLAFLAWVFREYQPLHWVAAHPLMASGYVLGWFAAGAVWASVKWVMRSASIARKYEAMRKEWVAKNGEVFAGGIWRDAVYKATGVNPDKLKPRIADHKAKVIGWMVWWPWSAFWTIVNDPVRRVFEMIYHSLAGALQKASDRLFSKFSELEGK